MKIVSGLSIGRPEENGQQLWILRGHCLGLPSPAHLSSRPPPLEREESDDALLWGWEGQGVGDTMCGVWQIRKQQPFCASSFWAWRWLEMPPGSLAGSVRRRAHFAINRLTHQSICELHLFRHGGLSLCPLKQCEQVTEFFMHFILWKSSLHLGCLQILFVCTFHEHE